MKRHHFFTITGMFAVVAGVVGLSGIITTFDVLARTPRGGAPAPKFALLTAVQSSTSGYQRPLQQAWSPQDGVMKLGFTVLGEQTKQVKVTALPIGASTKGLQFGFTIAVTDFSQVPLQFSAQHDAVLAAAQQAKGWSAQNNITVLVDPTMKGKWVTVYTFARNGDGVAALAGYPQQIDDAAAMVFQVPDNTALKEVSKVGVPFTLYVPPQWQGVLNPTAPLPLNQIIGYVGVATTYQENIELVGMKIGLDVDTWDKGSVALVRMPAVLDKSSVMAAGEAAQDVEPSIAALGFVNPENNKCAQVKNQVCVWPDESVTQFPFASGIIAKPKKDVLFAVTVDDLAMTSSTLYTRVLSVDWRYSGESAVYTWELDQSLLLPVAKFSPSYAYMTTSATTPSGAVSKTSNLSVLHFLIKHSSDANQPMVVNGVKVSIAASTPLLSGAACTVQVGSALGKILGQACIEDPAGGTVIVPFAAPLTLDANSSSALQVSVNASKANWETTLQVTGVVPLVNVDGQWIELPNNGPAVGKVLVF